MPASIQESRLLHFQESFAQMASILGKSGFLDGVAKMEAARQPSKVAHEYAEASKEIAKMGNEKEKFMKASDVLFQIYYGDKSDSAKNVQQSPDEKMEHIPKPEEVLFDLIGQVGCRVLANEFQQEMDKALTTGDVQHLHLAAQKLEMLQQLQSYGRQQAVVLNKQFPFTKLGLTEFSGASFSCNDHLDMILSQLPVNSWKKVPFLEGKGKFQTKHLPVSQDDNGSFSIGRRNQLSVQDELHNEIQRLDHEIYSMTMELKLLRDAEQGKDHHVSNDPVFRLEREIVEATALRTKLRAKRVEDSEESRQRRKLLEL